MEKSRGFSGNKELTLAKWLDKLKIMKKSRGFSGNKG